MAHRIPRESFLMGITVIKAGPPLRARVNHLTEAPKASRALQVLVVPGLGNSLEGHWQTWLQRQYARSVRVQQPDWQRPDLDAWADRIAQTMALHPRTDWVAAAHSFGALALAHHLQRQRLAGRPSPVRAALLVAPADPLKFGVHDTLQDGGALGVPGRVVASSSDPWMTLDAARRWAALWDTAFSNLGDAGHINIASGHGPWAQGRYWVDELLRDQHRQQRLARSQAPALHFAA